MDKQQVIDTYIEKNNKKSILGFLGINKMLGIDEAMKNYLNGENKLDIKSGKGFGDFLKGNILINVFLNNKKDELDKLKEYLDLNKDNKAQLESLASEIKKGTTVEKAIENPTINSTIPTVENYSQNPEIKTIRNSIEIKGTFANIKEVKNSAGQIILECKGETPYINPEVLDDLLGFAIEFFQKTGNTLTISSAYRTMENQKKQKAEKGGDAAEPGFSGHNLGLSMDLDGADRYSSKIGGINGMRDLAKKYNFYPLAGEDRHFDYKTLPNPDNRLAQAQVLDKNFQENNLG